MRTSLQIAQIASRASREIDGCLSSRTRSHCLAKEGVSLTDQRRRTWHITTTRVGILLTLAVAWPTWLRAADDGDKITISRSELQKLIQDEVQKALRKEKQNTAPTQPQKSSATATNLALPTAASASSGPAPAPSASSTQTVKASDTLRDVDNQGLFAVPNSPAASALGMNPDTMPRATLPKQLGLSNLNGVDIRGNPQTGLAVDVAVGQLFGLQNKKLPGGTTNPNALTLKEYGENYLWRLAMRTQFSFAETRGTTSQDKSLKLATGVMIPLLVAHDPAQIAADRAYKVDKDERTDERQFETNNLFHTLKVPVSLQTPIFGSLASTIYRHVDIAVGGYALGDSQDGSGSDLKYGGAAIYGTGDFSVSEKCPVLFVTNVTYRDHQQVPASSVTLGGSSMLVPEDSLLMGAGIQFGTKTINATAFWAWIKEWETNHKSEYSNRYGVLAEYHLPKSSFLGPNAFITLSAGEEIGGGDRPTSSFVLGGVKIGLGGDDFGNSSSTNNASPPDNSNPSH